MRIQPDKPEKIYFHFALCKKWPYAKSYLEISALQSIQASQMFTFERMFRLYNGTLLNGQLAVYKKYIMPIQVLRLTGPLGTLCPCKGLAYWACALCV